MTGTPSHLDPETLPLGVWRLEEERARTLHNAGLSAKGALLKARLFRMASEDLIGAGHSPDVPCIACYCPGRLEVLGKHTDYWGGRSLLGAPELGFALLGIPREDGECHMISRQSKGAFQSWSAPDMAGHKDPSHGWTRYPRVAHRRLQDNFGTDLGGADIAAVSDLPLAAGMSSSSALITATLLVLWQTIQVGARQRVSGDIGSPLAWAMFASCVENGQSFGPFPGDAGVGTFGGSEDHTAMFATITGQLSQFRFAPIARERDLELPADLCFVVAPSGLTAEKAAGARDQYNRLALISRELTELARSTSGHDWPHLGAYLAGGQPHYQSLQAALPKAGSKHFSHGELAARLEQCFLESEVLIPALTGLDTAAERAHFGELVARSTEAAALGLGNQVPETLALTQDLLDAGALAASPFGAGFGGSVWGLFERSKVSERLRSAGAKLQEAVPIELGPPAFVIPSKTLA